MSTTTDNTYYKDYYSQLEGAKILRFAGMDKDPEDYIGGDGFPTFIVRLANKQEIAIQISQDPEGNGGGFIFGLEG